MISGTKMCHISDMYKNLQLENVFCDVNFMLIGSRQTQQSRIKLRRMAPCGEENHWHASAFFYWPIHKQLCAEDS